MYEIASRYAGGTTVAFPTSKLSDRAPHSDEINKEHGEGGGLNANYRTADALCALSNILGKAGLWYGTHFYFKTAGDKTVLIEFRDETVAKTARLILDQAFRAAA